MAHRTRFEELAVEDLPRVEVSLDAGHLEVDASADGCVRVSIDARDPDAFEIARIGGTITVREGSRRRSPNRRARMLIEVPPGSDVTARAGSADVDARGRLGAVTCRTASGDVAVAAAERLDVTSGSGDVRIVDVDGDARFTTASGDVAVDAAGGRLDASTASGDVTARVVAGTVEISTASGDVTAGRVDGDAITITTLSGDVRLGLPPGIRVEPDISTLSGSVVLPPAARASESPPRRIVRVRLRTMSGDIRIERTT